MARIRILLACVLLAAPLSPSRAQQPSAEPVAVGNIADKLGIKIMANAPRELELGFSVTGTLADPKKLAGYGIKNMHEGARVTITCVGPNRVRVEADEMEPVEQRAVVTLKVSEDGSLTPLPASVPKAGKPPY